MNKKIDYYKSILGSLVYLGVFLFARKQIDNGTLMGYRAHTVLYILLFYLLIIYVANSYHFTMWILLLLYNLEQKITLIY